MKVYENGSIREMSFEEASSLKDWAEYFEMLEEKAANATSELLDLFRQMLVEDVYIKDDGKGNEGLMLNLPEHKAIILIKWFDEGGACNLELSRNDKLYKKLEATLAA